MQFSNGLQPRSSVLRCIRMCRFRQKFATNLPQGLDRVNGDPLRTRPRPHSKPSQIGLRRRVRCLFDNASRVEAGTVLASSSQVSLVVACCPFERRARFVISVDQLEKPVAIPIRELPALEHLLGASHKRRDCVGTHGLAAGCGRLLDKQLRFNAQPKGEPCRGLWRGIWIHSENRYLQSVTLILSTAICHTVRGWATTQR